jgi:hypothetical protein
MKEGKRRMGHNCDKHGSVTVGIISLSTLFSNVEETSCWSTIDERVVRDNQISMHHRCASWQDVHRVECDLGSG